MKPSEPKLSEKDFQKWFLDLAHLFGWKVLHVRKSIGKRGGEDAWQTTTNLRGWPDCFCFRPRDGRLLAAELKSEKGRSTVEQMDILVSLADCGIEGHIWRPSDRDEIERVMK